MADINSDLSQLCVLMSCIEILRSSWTGTEQLTCFCIIANISVQEDFIRI
jgi:hypothetical protein